jgi:predicted alpha/beta hydrolase
MSAAFDVETVEGLPFGKAIFSRIICFKAPYFGSIRPRFEEFRPGFARVSMKKRRAVTNHIGTVHAIAMCNLAELAAGTMTEIIESMRWLPKGMTVECGEGRSGIGQWRRWARSRRGPRAGPGDGRHPRRGRQTDAAPRSRVGLPAGPPDGRGARDTAKAADGFDLAVTRFPAEGAAWATMLLAGAMGVRQDFYEPLARFLAENGIHVLTFDYRGMGASREGGLRGFEADISTWAQSDLDAMLREARAMGPGLPAFALGHSLGGQLFGSVPEGARLDAFVTVTAGSGWYRHNERMRLQVRIFWFVAIPLLTPLFGYFPGKRLRMVGDLPAGVAWQWRRWAPIATTNLEGRRCGALQGVRSGAGFSFEDDPSHQALDRRAAGSIATRRGAAPRRPRGGRRRIGHWGTSCREPGPSGRHARVARWWRDDPSCATPGRKTCRPSPRSMPTTCAPAPPPSRRNRRTSPRCASDSRPSGRRGCPGSSRSWGGGLPAMPTRALIARASPTVSRLRIRSMSILPA